MQLRRIPHRVLLIALVVGALAAAVVAVASARSSRSAMDACTATPPGGTVPGRATVISVDWEWLPPGYVCVFADRNGRELGRRRP